MTAEEKVKYRLSDIGEKVGELALNYIENLEKENKQLKIDMEIADSQRQLAEKENEELKAQIEQLSYDNHVLKTSFITQQEHIKEVENDSKNCELWSYMIIAQKDEQIEKMKCCGNCAKIETCKLFAHIDIHVCKEWELAE